MIPIVSVVVPCGPGHAGVLSTCLASLAAQRFGEPFEVIVVNSADSQSVAANAARYDVRVLSGGGAGTAGRARNIGVAAAQAKILAFVDADCSADRDWLATLCGALSGNIIAVGGPVLNQLPCHPVAMIDNLMQFIDQAPGRPAGPARELPGCNLAMQRRAFDKIGRFPEDIFPGEDTIFSQRVAAEWPGLMQYVPAMRIRHRGRTALRDFVQHQRSFGFSRGKYGLNVSRQQQRLGRRPWLAASAAARRTVYFVFRTAQWNTLSLPVLIVCFPVLLVGLCAWTRGFSHGCRLAVGKTGQQ